MIQILDTTLRDGEQTSGVSFTSRQKFMLAKYLLQDVGVDRIEIGSSRTTQDDLEAIKLISAWAEDNGYGDRIEVLIYTDIEESINWMNSTGCQTVNILAKGSRSHCEKQLLISAEEHLDGIARTIEYATQQSKSINVFLEDWSRGFTEDKDYVMQAVEQIQAMSKGKIYLCDTLGVLSPDKTGLYVSDMTRAFPEVHFELHCHNDYGMAVANCLSGIQAGAKGVHTTVNGLGERAGNTPLEEIAVVINDFTNHKLGIDETKLPKISEMISDMTGVTVANNKPIVGKNVFTHTSGIHVDGQEKAELYSSRLHPSRFERDWEYTLGKLSGKSNVNLYLSKMDIQVDEFIKKRILQVLKESGLMNKKFSKQEFVDLVEEIRKKAV